MEQRTFALPVDASDPLGSGERRRRPEFLSYLFFVGLFATTFLV